MKTLSALILALILAISIAGCSLRQEVSTPEAAAPTVAPAPTVVVNSDLTLEQVKNASCSIQSGETAFTFTLVNGTYKTGDDTSVPGYYQVTMSDQVAFGDLNGDGVADAAVTVGISSGGTGVFEYVVAFISENSQPVQAGYYFVDDRAQIESMNIVDGEIRIDALVHSPNDPMCCPTLPLQAALVLPLDDGDVLWKTEQTTQTPDGSVRKITITSPEQGASVSSPITITGDVTIAPFENNLVYHCYDMAMNELSVGPLMVNAPDMGAPGNFELSLDLSSTGYTGEIFVTISDLSAADGSTLAMDSVLLNVK